MTPKHVTSDTASEVTLVSGPYIMSLNGKKGKIGTKSLLNGVIASFRKASGDVANMISLQMLLHRRQRHQRGVRRAQSRLRTGNLESVSEVSNKTL